MGFTDEYRQLFEIFKLLMYPRLAAKIFSIEKRYSKILTSSYQAAASRRPLSSSLFLKKSFMSYESSWRTVRA